MATTAPTTPPRRSGALPGAALELTPEAKRKIEENRLRAKAQLQKRATRTTSGAQVPNAFNKRPLEVVPADSTSPTVPNARTFPTTSSSSAVASTSAALQNAQAGPARSNNKSTYNVDDPTKPLPNMIGKFVDYDLSTLKNSKGGFLVDEEIDDDRALKERKQIEELKKQRQRQAERVAQDPHPSLDKDANPKCKVCGTIELDYQIYKVFGVRVCPKCRNENPDRFSLLTKTECKEDYLLTDPELRDTELLPHLLRPNPHRPTYSNMMLFLREQVEAFAFSPSKWGSPEALDAEFARRQEEKKRKKGKKFEEKLRDLRRKTRTNVWHKRQEEEHVHDFGEGTVVGRDGNEVQRCSECGLEVECETF